MAARMAEEMEAATAAAALAKMKSLAVRSVGTWARGSAEMTAQPLEPSPMETLLTMVLLSVGPHSGAPIEVLLSSMVLPVVLLVLLSAGPHSGAPM